MFLVDRYPCLYSIVARKRCILNMFRVFFLISGLIPNDCFHDWGDETQLLKSVAPLKASRSLYECCCCGCCCCWALAPRLRSERGWRVGTGAGREVRCELATDDLPSAYSLTCSADGQWRGWCCFLNFDCFYSFPLLWNQLKPLFTF